MFDGKLRLELLEARLDAKRLEDKHEALREAFGQLTDRTVASETEARTLAREKNELQIKVAVLMERLDLLANHLPEAPTESWNHISEEQEDADYQLHAGLIDRDEYEAILATAGAINTEVLIHP